MSALLACRAAGCRSRHSLLLDILALRHQLAVYQRSVPRPRIRPTDRLLWSRLACLWSGWQAALAFVQPRTVIKWQKKRCREHWRRLSQRGKLGRPPGLVALDCLVVPTLTNTILFVLVSLAHQRRRIVHVEAVLIATQSPGQNPYVERLIGSIRRDLLDHVIVFNERHLSRLLTASGKYSHRFRTHLSLAMDCPESRAVQAPERGEVIEVAEVGGLHHHYARQAA